jgi:toxin ParE1/3/4
MMEFRLSKLAESDLTDIWIYIADHDQRSADAQIDRIVERFVMLSQFQGAGRSREELASGLKSFSVDNYVIFYRIIDSGIEVIRVLHGSRDISPIFKGVVKDTGYDSAE